MYPANLAAAAPEIATALPVPPPHFRLDLPFLPSRCPGLSPVPADDKRAAPAAVQPRLADGEHGDLRAGEQPGLPVPEHEDVVRIPKTVFEDLLSQYRELQ